MSSSSCWGRYRWEAWSPFEKLDPGMKKTATDGTDATWAMTGPTPFTAKIMHVFINMDRMIGTDFEAGLGGLKSVSELDAGR